ncbi:unnamed protein product, partial [marine sediment metagenome]
SVTFYAECADEDKYLYVDTWSIEYADMSMPEPVKMVVFEGKLYTAYGTYLVRKDNDGVGVIKEFDQDITDLCVFQNPSATDGDNPTYRRLFIAQGLDNHYWYTDDGWTFYESAASTNAKYMSNIGDSQFWISDATNTITSSDSPINDEEADPTSVASAFATSTKVGGDYFEITSLVDHPDTVFVRKQDQAYYLSGSEVLPVAEGLEIEANTDIDYPLHFWQNKLYIPAGTNALYEYDIGRGDILPISPVKFAIGDTKYDGACGRGITSDNEYLYITVETGTR